MPAEMEEGYRLEMAELLKQENDLKAKLADVQQKLVAPEAKLEKAKAIAQKAKAALEQCLDEVKPLRSDKTLIEGELQMIDEKKSKLRQEAAFARGGGGIRPGTGALVEQLDQIAGGSMEEHAMKKEVRQAEATQALDALKKKMQG